MDPIELSELGITPGDTENAFRKQVRLQVYLPMALTIMLLIGIGLVLIRTATGSASVWADVSLMFLLIVWAVIALLIAVASAAMAYGLFELIKSAPPYFAQARIAIARAQKQVEQASEVAVKPVAVPKAVAGAIADGARYLAGIFS